MWVAITVSFFVFWGGRCCCCTVGLAVIKRRASFVFVRTVLVEPTYAVLLFLVLQQYYCSAQNVFGIRRLRQRTMWAGGLAIVFMLWCVHKTETAQL